MRAPSGENAALCTALSCPRRAAISAPVAASQMRAVRSTEAVTMRAPSGENAALRTRPLVPAQGGDLGAGGGVPDAGRAVVGGGDDAGAVGRERGAPHPLSCPRRAAISAAGGGVPDAGRAVIGGGDDAGAVGRERGAPHPILVPAQGGDLGAGGGVPDAGRAVVGGGDDAGAVGREGGALHPILVPAQGGDLGAGGGVPDAGGAVVGGGDDAGAVGRERGALHPILVPAQGGDLGAGGGVPDAGRAVPGGGDDAGAVGRERGAPHPILVPAQGGDLGAGGGVPDAGGAVVGGGDDAGAVGRERGALHRTLVPAQAQPFGAGRRQSRPAGPGPAIGVEPSRTCAGQAGVAEPSEQLAGEFAPVRHQRWKGKPDRSPDPPHVGVGAFGEIAAVKRTCIGRVQPRLDPGVVREQVVRRSILVSAPQMQDQEPPAIGLVGWKRVPHPAAFGAYRPDHRGMGCLQPFGAKPVAQIPQHVVVQPQRAPAEVERLQQRQPVQPHDEVVGVVLVEPAGLRPERLDDSKRHVFVLRQHGQLGESRCLVRSEVLDAGLDAEPNRLVALGFVPRVEHEWPVAGETSLEAGDRVGERFTPRHPLTQPAIRDGQHLRPEAKTFRQGGEPERGRGLVRARQMSAHHAGCLRRAHLVDRAPTRSRRGGRPAAAS